jgi:hypothetical protein
MENLFSEDPQFSRVQYNKLSDNVRNWQQEIGALVQEKLPKSMGLDIVIKFQKVDDEKGYALGTAIAKDDNSDQSIGVPILVKAWHLAPLDLFFKDGKLYPLNENNIAQVFQQHSLGASVAKEKSPPNLADDVFSDIRTPPMGGKYSYSAPFSELIKGTLGVDDIQMFKAAIQQRPEILAKYHVHRTMHVVEKLASEKPAATEQDELNKERAMATFTIKKEGPDSYRMYSAPDGVYDPVLISTDRRGLKSFLDMRKAEFWDYEQDPLNEIDQYGHFTIEAPKSPYGADVDGPTGSGVDGSGGYGAALGKHRSPWVFDPRQDDRVVTTVDKYGRYGVKDADGVMAKGWVLPNVVDFDGKSVPTKLFLGKALASYQSRIAGIPLNDDADVNLLADSLDTGKTGTLVYRDGKRVLATVPFMVQGVTVFERLRSVSVVDYRGNQANLILSPNIEGIVRINEQDGRSNLGPLMGPNANYLVSAKMFFVRMPRLCAISEGPDDFKGKAAEQLDKNPLKVAMANDRFIFKGGAISKYAAAPKTGIFKSAVGKNASFNFNYLPRHEAEFLLRSWGLGHEKTAEVLDGVGTRIYLEVHHLDFPRLSGRVKLASGNLRATIDYFRPSLAELVKCAADIEDAQTVDSVLSLGFINPENVARFAAAKPMLWEVSHMLAKLLLGSRLGIEDIPEESARAALFHLQRVLDGLGRLKMYKDHQEKTSAVKPQPNHIGGRLMGRNTPIGFAR